MVILDDVVLLWMKFVMITIMFLDGWSIMCSASIIVLFPRAMKINKKRGTNLSFIYIDCAIKLPLWTCCLIHPCKLQWIIIRWQKVLTLNKFVHIASTIENNFMYFVTLEIYIQSNVECQKISMGQHNCTYQCGCN
jgi:hypothetical protein